MKKLLILLFSLLISFNSYGLIEKTVCIEILEYPYWYDTQDRGRTIYLPNKTKPFTGKNLCEYESGQIKSEGKVKKGKLVSETRYRYHENGQLEVEQHFKDGKKDGKEIYYWIGNFHGKKMIERNWKDGECISGCN